MKFKTSRLLPIMLGKKRKKKEKKKKKLWNTLQKPIKKNQKITTCNRLGHPNFDPDHALNISRDSHWFEDVLISNFVSDVSSSQVVTSHTSQEP